MKQIVQEIFANIREQFNEMNRIFVSPLRAWRIFFIIGEKFLSHSPTVAAKFSLILKKIRLMHRLRN